MLTRGRADRLRRIATFYEAFANRRAPVGVFTDIRKRLYQHRFEDVVRDVDAVFDTVGGELTERSLAVLKPGGIYVTPAGQPDAEAAAGRGVRASGMMAQANPTDLAEITRL